MRMSYLLFKRCDDDNFQVEVATFGPATKLKLIFSSIFMSIVYYPLLVSRNWDWFHAQKANGLVDSKTATASGLFSALRKIAGIAVYAAPGVHCPLQPRNAARSASPDRLRRTLRRWGGVPAEEKALLLNIILCHSAKSAYFVLDQKAYLLSSGGEP